MFINFTNHPSKNWSEKQRLAASEYGEIHDIPFPDVDPNGDESYVEALAGKCTARIIAHSPAAVLCQGEMTLAFAVASALALEHGITVLAACSERVSVETAGESGTTVKRLEFSFTRFREYL